MERLIDFQPSFDADVSASFAEEPQEVERQADAAAATDETVLSETRQRLEMWRRGGALASDSVFRAHNTHGNRYI